MIFIGAFAVCEVQGTRCRARAYGSIVTGCGEWCEACDEAFAEPATQALASDVVFNQPVLYEFQNLRSPTTLIIGRLDRTAIGRDLAARELAKRLGDYPVLGRQAAQTIADANLVEFDNLGHSPQVEVPERIHQALLRSLGTVTPD